VRVPRPLPAAVLASTGGDPDAVRRHILDAAQRVIARDGLAAASTRTIADEAGLAGGTLYNYFDGHTQLLAKAIVHHAASLMGPVVGLPSRAGRYTVGDNLRYFVRQAAGVLDQLVPELAAAFSDSELLAAVRREMADGDRMNDPALLVERYLLAERDIGRVAPDADCRAAAALLASLCHEDAFQRHLRGRPVKPGARNREIELIARSVTQAAPDIPSGRAADPAAPPQTTERS
jgi:AcrR family transcriptional regulator